MVALVLFMSGCASSESAGSAAPAQASSVVSAGDEASDTASIQGSVVDDAVVPIPAAQVAILDLQLVAVTDENGAFEFRNVAPGTYKVAAAALGYQSSAKSVDAFAGQATTVTFSLAPIPLPGLEWLEVIGPTPGFANCVFGTPLVAGVCPGMGNAPNEKSSFRYGNYNETTHIVGELRWDQATAGTSRVMGLTFSYVGRPNTHWWCFGSGVSPVQWMYVYDGNDCVTTGRSQQQGASKPPAFDQTLVSFVAIPFTSPGVEDPFPAHVALQQRFDVVFSLFQNLTPDELYTAFPDA